MSEQLYINVGRYRLPVRSRRDTRTGKMRYRVRLTKDIDASGNRHDFDVTDTSIEGLTVKLENLLHPYHYLMTPGHSTISFKAIAEQWYQDGCIAWVLTTQKSYRATLDHFILPLTGDLLLVQVDAAFLHELFKKLSAAEVPSSVCEKIQSVFSCIFTYCIQHKYLLTNPAKSIRIQKVRNTQDALSEQDQARLLTAFPEPSVDRNIVLAMLFTGGRVEETLGLTWHKLREETGILKIDSVLSYRYEGNKRVYYLRGFTKTRAARNIALSPAALSLFQEQSRLQERMKEEAGALWYEPIPDLIFTDAYGEPIKQGSFGNRFRDIVRAKLPDLEWVHPYTLRHTAISNFYSVTHDIVLTAEFAGHTDLRTTLIYTHSRPDDRIAVARNLDEIHRKIISYQVIASDSPDSPDSPEDAA